MRATGMLLIAAAMVAGCSGGGADSDGDGQITASEIKDEMASGGAIDMQAGEWEVKTQFTDFEAPGLPAGTLDVMRDQMGKGVTVTTCLTEEEVKDPGADFFGGEDAGNCSFDAFDRSGNTMTVAMTCKPEGGMTMTSKMDGSFSRQSYEMRLDTRMTGGPTGEMAMKGTITGRRIGACAS